MRASYLSSFTLSSEGIRLTPCYNGSMGCPSVLEADERVYDYKKDKTTKLPQSIGHVLDRTQFSNHGYERINVECPIKAPQSDVYHLPENLEPFFETLQAIIYHEHNTTPAAFNRVAYVAIRHGVRHVPEWHFDGDETRTITRTYNVADKDPTRFAVVPINMPSQQELKIYEQNAYSFMEKAALSTWEGLPEQQRKIFTGQPYEIMRHGTMTLHRAGEDAGRTLVSVFYGSVCQRTPNNNPMMDKVLDVSAPLKDAAQMLQEHCRGLKF